MSANHHRELALYAHQNAYQRCVLGCALRQDRALRLREDCAWNTALNVSNVGPAPSVRNGKRAAAIMSLIQSARMNGHNPHAYLKDVLTRLPTQRASEITELLPHKWVNSLD